MGNRGLVCFSGNKVTLEGLSPQLHWVQHSVVYVWGRLDNLGLWVWPTAVPETGGALGIVAQLCLSFSGSPAHHVQPSQKIQILLCPSNCLISIIFKIYLNTLMFDALICQEHNDSCSHLKLITETDSALIYIVSLLLFFTLLFFFLKQSGLIQDIWLIKLQPSAAVLSPADLHCLKSATCFRAAVSHCLFLCQLLYCKSAPFTQHTVTGLCLLWWPFTVAVVLDNLYKNTGHVHTQLYNKLL